MALDKVVLITGAPSGIGAAIARELARAVRYAIEQPDDVDVSDIVVRPTASA